MVEFGEQELVGYDAETPPCRHCGAHYTHWTRYDTEYDCHCNSCGRVFMSREQEAEIAGKEVQ